MHTYEFITPSDAITFRADNNAIAYAVALYLGSGKAACQREDGVEIDCMLLFATPEETKKSILDNLGMEFKDFMEANKAAVAAAFSSFAYTSIAGRKQYDERLTAASDVTAFKAAHEDKKRTSLSRWVNTAWMTGKALQEQVAA